MKPLARFTKLHTLVLKGLGCRVGMFHCLAVSLSRACRAFCSPFSVLRSPGAHSAPSVLRSPGARQRPLLFSVLCSLALLGCSGIRPPDDVDPIKVRMTVTGYCDCGDCCGWERSWLRLGTPVYSSGPNKGKPKEVGITATGTETRHGTAAVDRRRWAFGTVFHVPGYGYARAEDTGGAIKGNHIDLWFPSHDAALRWGRRTLTVTVWPARR